MNREFFVIIISTVIMSFVCFTLVFSVSDGIEEAIHRYTDNDRYEMNRLIKEALKKQAEHDKAKKVVPTPRPLCHPKFRNRTCQEV